MGGTVEEEMEGFKKVVEVVMAEFHKSEGTTNGTWASACDVVRQAGGDNEKYTTELGKRNLVSDFNRTGGNMIKNGNGPLGCTTYVAYYLQHYNLQVLV